MLTFTTATKVCEHLRTSMKIYESRRTSTPIDENQREYLKLYMDLRTFTNSTNVCEHLWNSMALWESTNIDEGQRESTTTYEGSRLTNKLQKNTKSTKVCEHLRKSMRIYENRRISTQMNEKPRESLKVYKSYNSLRKCYWKSNHHLSMILEKHTDENQSIKSQTIPPNAYKVQEFPIQELLP